MVIAQIQKKVQKQLRKYLKPEKRIATEALIRLFHFGDYVLPKAIKEKIINESDVLVNCHDMFKQKQHSVVHAYSQGFMEVLLGEWLMGGVHKHEILWNIFDAIRYETGNLAFNADCYIVLKQCPQWFSKYYDCFPGIEESELKTNVNIHTGLHPEMFMGVAKDKYFNNQGRGVHYEHNEMWYNSKTETIISNALDSEKVLYFPNPGCRIENKYKQVDFLVCHNGNWGILECDGGIHHTSAAKDHARDDMFNAHGIWFIRRYPASQCYEKPNETVRHFLKRMEEIYVNRK